MDLQARKWCKRLFFHLFCHLMLLLQMLSHVRSHVVLTFPPARKYALDFLDSNRLPATMCGMPKGFGPETSIMAGSTFNVTWNLGFHHTGGFKLELLDHLERPLMDLTPVVDGSQFKLHNLISQKYEVKLPKDYECRSCSIRLSAQLNDLGSEFLLKTCGDVDIVNVGRIESCSENGISRDGRCYCKKNFHGDRCQYKDECTDDDDCGPHGHCILIDSKNYPKKQCFCEPGWFGTICDKESAMKSKKLALDGYNQQDLSNDVKLYWQLLPASEEIEMVVVARTVSYVAVGWRPLGANSKCREVPELPSITPKSDSFVIRQGKQLPNDPAHEKESNEKLTTSTAIYEASSSMSFQNVFSGNNTTNRETFDSETQPLTSTPKVSVSTSSRVRFPPRRPLIIHRQNTNKPVEIKPVTNDMEAATTVTTKLAATTVTTKPSSTSLPSIERVETKISNKVTVVTEISSDISVQEETADFNPASNEQNSPEVLSSESNSQGEESEPSDDNLRTSVVPDNKVELMEAMASEEVERLDNVEVKSYVPDGRRSKRNTSEILMAVNPFYPRGPLHAMDCVDMVIGSAREDFSRIRDYYSRDMSTPQPDEFWGGTDDLTSAFGFESKGITFIIFRKKITSNDLFDHSISNDTVHFIWAIGQDPMNSVKERHKRFTSDDATFYAADSLKYHGKEGQRGMTTLNLYKTSMMESSKSSASNNCRGEWKTPTKCTIDDCEYKAIWEYQLPTDQISFTIFTNHTNAWTGIGFSRDARMTNTDAIIGWVNDNGQQFLMDTWISNYSSPKLDENQDIENESGKRNASGTTLMFSRKRDTGDTKEDLAFTNSECLYLIFPFHGGSFNGINKKIKKHEKTPLISSRTICIQACESVPGVVSASTFEPVSDETTSGNNIDNDPSSNPSPTLSTYLLTIRLPSKEAQNIINKDEIERITKLTIRSEISSILKDVKGFKDIEVDDALPDPNNTNWWLAKMKIYVDQESLYVDSDVEDGTFVLQDILNSSIAKGKIGQLQVDPSYYLLESPDSSLKPTNATPDYVAASDQLMPIYAIIAAASALGVLLIIQIISAACRNRQNRNMTVSKEQLIANSGWKDYSATASSKYSYEPFSSHEESIANVNKTPDAGGSMIGSHRNGKSAKNISLHPGDSHSLMHRSRLDGGGDPNHYSRRSESLPRLGMTGRSTPSRGENFHTQDRSYRNGRSQSTLELQPDFYFMPSQRRYKGEVVRVYVDYNNPNYRGKE